MSIDERDDDAPLGEFEIDDLAELARLVATWRASAMEQCRRDVFEFLTEAGAPRDRLQEIAQPLIDRAYGLIEEDIRQHACRIEREILGSTLN